MTMEESPYYLSNHTFVCIVDNHYVFLDLRSNKYLCLTRTHTDAVKGLLNDQQADDESSATIRLRDTSDSDSSAIAQALLRKELLVRDVADGKPPTIVHVERPLASAMLRSDKSRTTIRLTHIWNFFAAAVAASKDVRWGSIEQTVSKVEARKSAHAADTTAIDSGAITDLFEIFRTLRPYYPRPYLCMFDSLALVHFLARYGVFPQWVYGVKLKPFAAHCWVQAGHLVVNDGVDYVRSYIPIMSV